jgi:hypothetical protein
LNYQIGYFGVDLDGLCEDDRTTETNLGNFIADVFRTQYEV